MALGLDTLLPTPYGWTSVQDLRPGDLLFDELGYACSVLKVSEPYITETYTLQAGWGKSGFPEPTEITISEDQCLMSFTYKRFEVMGNLQDNTPNLAYDSLFFMPENWPVWSIAEVPRESKRGKKAKPKAETFNAVQLSNSILYSRKKDRVYLNHAVPITFPLQLNSRDLPIPPYILGVLMNYRRENKIRVTTESFDYYAQKFAEYGYVLDRPEGFTKSKPYAYVYPDIPEQVFLRMQEMDFDKTVIPKEYLRGSIQQRMELLQGLLDQWDQKFIRGCRLTYIAKNHSLGSQIVELVNSLGYPAIQRYPVGSFKSIISWHMAINPFLRPKFKTRYAIFTHRAGHNLERYVWKVYRCEKTTPKPVRKITVQSPYGLYSVSDLFLPMKCDNVNTSS